MSEAQRLFLHVGTPKSGTSFVQDLLFRNREALAAEGVSYPADRFDGHFLAALDLLELSWGGLEREAVGAWDALAARVREWPGTSIVSHEILATASRAQVARALESFGDVEVHLVLSVRDLVRQIPAEWQENVKHRRTFAYTSFLDLIRDPERSGRLASWFWQVQDVPEILARWGADLPPERVHVITVPRPGAPRELLWQRFAEVFGIDAEEFRPETDRVNTSLGAAQATLVRRVNERVRGGVLAGPHYRALVRELLAHRTLSAMPGTTRVVVPPEVREWARQLCEAWAGQLHDAGYHVVGDLADLRPEPWDGRGTTDPDRTDAAEVADSALEAVVALLEEAARLRDVENALRLRLEDAHGNARQAWAVADRRIGYRVRRRVVIAAQDNRALGAALGIYRRVRGRSSPAA